MRFDYSLSSHWILVQKLMIWLGMILVPCLAAAIVWSATRDRHSHTIWFPRVAFWLATVWVLLFTCTFFYGVRVFGGVGYDGKIYALVLIVMLQSCLTGVLTFRFSWRLLAAIPALPAAYMILAWFRAWLTGAIKQG
jgi:hypothetical protein